MNRTPRTIHKGLVLHSPDRGDTVGKIESRLYWGYGDTKTAFGLMNPDLETDGDFWEVVKPYLPKQETNREKPVWGLYESRPPKELTCILWDKHLPDILDCLYQSLGGEDQEVLLDLAPMIVFNAITGGPSFWSIGKTLYTLGGGYNWSLKHEAPERDASQKKLLKRCP